VLLGDVGGTNIRLVLAHIAMSDRDRKQIIQEKTVDSRSVSSFEEAVKNFLKEFENSGTWPTVAVVGIAGPVDNNTVEVTNCTHWPPVDGEALS
jgi:glucokinase